MVFLDVKKKMWVIRELEIPVIEIVSMKEMSWFRNKLKEVTKIEQDGTITQTEAFAIDDEWWEKTSQVGLGMSVDDVLESGCTEPEFRELMAEVYGFLAISGTIERAKQSALYAVGTQKKELLQKETTQN